MEVIASYFNAVNFPATVLLLLVLAYWLLVVVGVAGLEFLDFGGLQPPELGDPSDLVSGVEGAGGLLKAVLAFFYMGRVPTMVLLSVFALVFWLVTVMTNQYFNPHGDPVGLLYTWVPTMVGSLLLTKLIFWPMLPLFDQLNQSSHEVENTLIGKQAMVTTSQVTERFGQVTIEQDGPPIVLNVRARPLDSFAKGDVVQIDSYEPTDHTYLVVPCGEKPKNA